MLSAEDFLSHLRSLDIRLWKDGGKLRYRVPKGAMTPALKAEIARRKIELLPLLSQPDERAPALRAGQRPERLPLSFAQQRLWFLDRLEASSVRYNEFAALRISGALDIPALSRSFQEIVRRHEILRTCFAEAEGEPFQRVSPRVEAPLPIIDLSGLKDSESALQTRRIARGESLRPFDLSQGPLMRLLLLRISARSSPGEFNRQGSGQARNDHVLLVCMHHIVTDGWSTGVLVGELAQCYQAFSRRRLPSLGDLPIQYADYALWQRECLQGDAVERQVKYWKGQLQSAPSLLELPWDRPRPALQGHLGGLRFFRLSTQLSDRLTSLSRRPGTTLYMTLLSAYAILLSRLSRQEDICIGTLTAGRSRRELEALIGFFANTLVMRIQLEGNPSFLQLLGRVKDVSRQALSHQEIPFEQLVGRLKPQRDLSQTPIFQTVFVFQNAPFQALEMPGLKISSMTLDRGVAKFDLVLSMEEGPEGIHGYFEYNAHLFEAETIERWRGHFITLLDRIASDPQQRIGQIPLLGEQQRREILRLGAALSRKAARSTLHDAFRQAALESPHRTALCDGGESLRYDQLEGRSNRLAHHLRRCGVGPESLVALCLERSLQALVAMLGVLKAGGAYLPLDPDHPKQRLSFMLDDSGADWVIAQRSTAQRVPGEACEVFLIDEHWPLADALSQEPPEDAAGPANRAYVIYTSGSTGRPKGVEVTHANALRLFQASQPAFGFSSSDVWTLFHSFSFDFSVWEIWGALLNGGRLVVVPRMTARSPRLLAELLRREEVTVLNQTPSAFRQLSDSQEALEILGRSRPANLRWVIFGGEKLEPSSLQGWMGRFGQDRPRLVNMYGITETTVHVTRRELGRGDLKTTSSPIGSPLPDLSLHVLDRFLEPAPIGVPGELFIGGLGPARGYLGRRSLTAGGFLPDPFASDPGRRLYRSGDLARRLPGGDIDYLGRVDHQVKIRGFRIELGEIEAALLGHPRIFRALALARSQPGDEAPPRLVAYIATAQGDPQQDADSSGANGATEIDASALREFLRRRLPDYMLPAAYVVLADFPLTANGKIDRKALPEPDSQRPSLREAYLAPRDGRERSLAAIWSQALGLERVGVRDNFFDLGGDSIRSIQVLAQARKQGLEFELQDLFRHQTIEALAGLNPERSRESAQASPIAPFDLVSEEDRNLLSDRFGAEVEDAYPVGGLQWGMLFHGEEETDRAIYHDIVGLTLKAPLDLAGIVRCLARLRRRHAALRLSFDLAGFSRPLQLVARDVRLPLYCVDLSRLSPRQRKAETSNWLESAKRWRFDVTKAPLLRFTVLRTDPQHFSFCLTCHHAVLDGWSIAVLMKEFFRSYARMLGMELPAPSSPPIGELRDFIALEMEASESPSSRDFWSNYLEGADAARMPRLPSRPRAAGAGNSKYVQLAPELLDDLQRLASSCRVPIKSVFLAAHLRVISWVSSKADVTTGLASNGRLEGNDGERVLGVFLNSLPLRAKLKGGTWRQLVGQAFEAERELIPHRRVPLAQLQSEHGSSGLFETLFNYVHFHVFQGAAYLEGIEIQDLIAHAENSFPLTCHFEVDPKSQQTLMGLAFDPKQLTPQQVDSISGYYQRSLSAMASNPEGRYELDSLLSPAEKQWLLERVIDAVRDSDEVVEFHEWISLHARRRPDHLAIDARESAEATVGASSGTALCGPTLTYAQLEAASNQLARRLQRQGIGPERRAALFLDRSCQAALAWVAILKSGGAVVPLDSALPKARLQFMLEDSQAELVVTSSDLAERLPDAAAPRFLIDRQWPDLAGESAGPPASSPSGDRLAYVIYTSGSTGQPKGALVEHRSLCNLALACRHRMAMHPGMRVLQMASLSFDASVGELAWAFANGATLCPGPAGLSVGQELADCLRRRRITCMFITPSALSVLPPDPLPDLEILMAGGEEVGSELARIWAPGRRFYNFYGPTEATVGALVGPCDGEQKPPVGTPLANVRAYVVDAHLQPLPAGLEGELMLGGAAVARGYLERPGLTAERFLPDPFAAQPGSRIYRSGDLARWLPNGDIDYLGRIDSQVKIRGFRIEPGEVEACLQEHPAVAHCAVLARGSTGGDLQLVAYLVAEDEGRPTQDLTSALRRHAAQRLPEYMVPSAFLKLEALPLTRNGKLDRRALPDLQLRPQEASRKPPRTPIENKLCALWKNLLGLDSVSRDDDFFHCGGHSLLATQAVSRLRQEYSLELPLKQFFENSTPESLARRIADALGRPDELQSEPIQPMRRQGAIPLSFAQQRLWFLDRSQGGRSVTYNIPIALGLLGELNLACLQAALDEIIRRHEALRTTFPFEDGQPQQLLAAPSPLPLPLIDLQALPQEMRRREVRRLARQDSLRPFDLAQGPLIRCAVAIVENRSAAGGAVLQGESVLLSCTHHIVSDGWSIGVFSSELSTLYSAAVQGRPSPLAELPIQYVDFSDWQRSRLAGGGLQAQIDYWKQQLKGAPSLLELPYDYPRPSIQSFRGASRRFTIDAELTGAWRELSRSCGTTLFIALLCAFGLLLSRHCNQRTILLGTALANRNRRETEGLIGFFVNALPLRLSLQGNPTFLDFLEAVKATAVEAYSQQDLPFDQLVEVIQPQRTLSHAPLVQAMFDMVNVPSQELQLPGLTFSHYDAEMVVSKFDIACTAAEVGDEIAASLDYSTDLFEPTSIERIESRFRTVLRNITEDPSRRVDDLPLTTSAERRQLLISFNKTHQAGPRRLCVHHLFRRQVELRPNAIALIGGGREFTFEELDRHAARLAWRLLDAGLEQEGIVGIFVERSNEMVVAMLAVLMAGGAYLPLDPDYPPQRLAFMIADTDVSLLLTQERLLPSLPSSRARFLTFDAEPGEIPDPGQPGPPDRAHPDSLAYVIYTSGSTGKPKGAMVTHNGLVNHNFATIRNLDLKPEDRALQFHAFSFDVCTEEVFSTLAAGAAVVLWEGHRSPGFDEFEEFARELRISVLNVPVSYWHEWTAALVKGRTRIPSQTRIVCTGGEAVMVDRYNSWQEIEPSPPLFRNTYGPTECSIAVTSFRAEEHCGPLRTRGILLIGHPYINTTIYVLDPQMRPAPLGVGGELFIGGLPVGRGYWRRPGLTAERFLPDPFSSRLGSRLYRTGDLVRYRESGDIEFLGRIDDQVKLRGFRIELGEIDSLLTAHPAVTAAASKVHSKGGDKRIVAYVSLEEKAKEQGDFEGLSAELAEHLRKQVPDYMVPAQFVELASLPLNPSGKIDRRNLPEPPRLQVAEGELSHPETESEREVAEAWAATLGLEQVGLRQNFFEVGGSSIKAVSLLSRLDQRWPGAFKIHDLFDRATVFEQGRMVDSWMKSRSQASLEPRPKTMRRVAI